MTGRKLGRGLDMLIGRESSQAKKEVLLLDPTTVKPNPQQPRKRFSINELESLKASIGKEGVLQPILVRKVDEGYELVAGERRLRAAQDLQVERIPAIVVTVPDERLLELALIENIQREDLNPIELAQAYRQLMESRSWSQEALAEALGLSRPGVANTVRLLELPEDMQGSLVRGHITMGHAKVLLSVGDVREQRLLFERIAEDKMSVRELEGAKDQIAAQKDATHPAEEKKRRAGSAKSPQVVSLEEQLSERLGTKVRIREKAGRGRISIEFYSTEDFEKIRRLLLGSHE